MKFCWKPWGNILKELKNIVILKHPGKITFPLNQVTAVKLVLRCDLVKYKTLFLEFVVKPKFISLFHKIFIFTDRRCKRHPSGLPAHGKGQRRQRRRYSEHRLHTWSPAFGWVPHLRRYKTLRCRSESFLRNWLLLQEKRNQSVDDVSRSDRYATHIGSRTTRPTRYWCGKTAGSRTRVFTRPSVSTTWFPNFIEFPIYSQYF